MLLLCVVVVWFCLVVVLFCLVVVAVWCLLLLFVVPVGGVVVGLDHPAPDPFRRTPLHRTPPPDRPIFPSPATISFFLSLTVCLLVEFWWFVKTGTSNVHV